MLNHRTFIQCSGVNYQMFIFMNINENIRNKRKIMKINGGVHANLSTSQLLTSLYYKPWYQFNANTYHVYLMDQYANYLKIVFMNIN